ncbi:conserved hypothetical protein [Vibrio crassostreae]|uniref:RNA polymerase sigma factor n=1 Tax=Vibrio crassostreae TaxID=246167 RepID=UPI001B30E339|nr:sigma-70 family RNA polymerase sigma factor [Vibrio crassostreae]CAK2028582.1 conserved hypothetical protein [Vibrio crassostreae]CAK2032248.1 conserved hypothetical protein [Vibrio crassostreae]CAK2033465.1 conserved hypothetical protein [Vibrio crassostreae]CAK2034579.1 conserved hypothetical protein [Vibrio crassostreae]CAK2036531.1 conserved hypothetical protein [Vibrio crassostreae]
MSNRDVFDVILKAADGDKIAFERLVRIFTDVVLREIKKALRKNDFYKILYSNIEEAADDVTTEVWLTLYKSMDKKRLNFDSEQSFNNYLAIVCRHRTFRFMSKRIKNRTRKGSRLDKRHEHSNDDLSEKLINDRRVQNSRKRNVRFQSIEEIGHIDLTSSSSLEKELSDELLADLILDKLTDKERTVLELTLEKDSQAEVAEALGVDVRTVFNRVKSIEAKSRKYRSRK